MPKNITVQNCAFNESAYDQMLNYDWRGNVRELEHTIERAILLCKDGQIDSLNIPKNVEATISFADLRKIQPPTNGNISAGNSGNGQMLAVPEDLSEEELFGKIGEFIVGKLKEPEDDAELNDVFNLIESGVVLAALRRTKGNKQAAANLLGLYRPRLYGMIKRHSLEEKMD